MASPHAVEADRLLIEALARAKALMQGSEAAVGTAALALCAIGRAILAIGDSE